jgi:hypothetical protein
MKINILSILIGSLIGIAIALTTLSIFMLNYFVAK